jgi:hypothetical protein
MSVIVTAKLDNQDRIILKSTRYDERSLIDYAKGFKFLFVKSVTSPENRWYKLIVFAREA